MTQEQIKAECEFIYKKIKEAEDRLREIRLMCNHPNTFKGKYSYRVGAINDATICSDCGVAIKIHF